MRFQTAFVLLLSVASVVLSAPVADPQTPATTTPVATVPDSTTVVPESYVQRARRLATHALAKGREVASAVGQDVVAGAKYVGAEARLAADAIKRKAAEVDTRYGISDKARKAEKYVEDEAAAVDTRFGISDKARKAKKYVEDEASAIDTRFGISDKARKAKKYVKDEAAAIDTRFGISDKVHKVRDAVALRLKGATKGGVLIEPTAEPTKPAAPTGGAPAG